jgi:RecJ-like exonuclease
MATDGESIGAPSSGASGDGTSRQDDPGRRGSNRVSRFFRRMFASEAELEAEELQRDARQSGCTAVCDAQRGDTVSVTGRLRTVVYTPRTTLPTLEAELYDGSDLVTLVWLGRRNIPGIQPGAIVAARGRIAIRDNRKVIYNPYYELEATS